MKYPVLRVDKEKVLRNALTVVEFCSSSHIEVWGVTKGLSGDPRLASLYLEAGLAGIADSRLSNLRKIRGTGVPLPLQMMRIAMQSELEDLADTADVSLQSEVPTILALDAICAGRGVTRDVLLMIDIGDLREGFWETELPSAGAALGNLRGGVRLTGVAANFACASGVLPSPENMSKLAAFRDILSKAAGAELPVISVGGTCCLKIIEEKGAPKAINQLRLCEGLLLGTDTAFDRDIPYLERGALSITAEIVECRHKPSFPVGEIGLQAFGEKPVFMDRGMRKRALLAIGRQDVNIDKITPLDPNVSIVTASSDHLILDVTDADSPRPPEEWHKTGGVVSFRPQYPAMLACATSEYVELVFE